jgi:hypothetical protein
MTAREVAASLKNRPTKCVEKGEIAPPRRVPASRAYWILEYKEEGEHVERIVLDKVMAALAEERESLLRMQDENMIVVNCSIYTTGSPGVVFTPEMVALISSVGAAIDVDIITLPAEDDEEDDE